MPQAEQFSLQDKLDLAAIARRLPANDPRRAKITTALQPQRNIVQKATDYVTGVGQPDLPYEHTAFQKHPPNLMRKVEAQQSPEKREARARLSENVGRGAAAFGTVAPVIANPVRAGAALAGGVVGSGGGAWAGREAGRPWGEEELGGKVGSVVGGLAGAYGGYRTGKLMTPGRLRLLQQMLPFAQSTAEPTAEQLENEAFQRQNSESIQRPYKPPPGGPGPAPLVNLATGTQQELEEAQQAGALARNKKLAQQVGMWSAGRKGAGVPQ